MNKSGVILTAIYMLYNKTKLKVYDALSLFCCSARCRSNREDPSSVCLLVVSALSKIVLSGWKSLGQGAPVDENDPFADLEPDIFEEERNEIVVHED